jgi:hypothetical protein
MPERRARMKDTDPNRARFKSQTYTVYQPKHPNTLELEVTKLSPMEAAAKVLQHISGLSIYLWHFVPNERLGSKGALILHKLAVKRKAAYNSSWLCSVVASLTRSTKSRAALPPTQASFLNC